MPATDAKCDEVIDDGDVDDEEEEEEDDKGSRGLYAEAIVARVEVRIAHRSYACLLLSVFQYKPTLNKVCFNLQNSKCI